MKTKMESKEIVEPEKLVGEFGLINRTAQDHQ